MTGARKAPLQMLHNSIYKKCQRAKADYAKRTE